MPKLHLDAANMTINPSSFTESFFQCFCIFCQTLRGCILQPPGQHAYSRVFWFLNWQKKRKLKESEKAFSSYVQNLYQLCFSLIQWFKVLIGVDSYPQMILQTQNLCLLSPCYVLRAYCRQHTHSTAEGDLSGDFPVFSST